jgi:hypothetical protein
VGSHQLNTVVEKVASSTEGLRSPVDATFPWRIDCDGKASTSAHFVEITGGNSSASNGADRRWIETPLSLWNPMAELMITHNYAMRVQHDVLKELRTATRLITQSRQLLKQS